MKKLFSFIICVLLLTACGTGYEVVDSNVAMTLMEQNAIVIDVRTADEYATGHIEGSINIPVDNISSINYDKDALIIVYCASGMRSSNAAKTLANLGYTNIHNLDGGLINWGFDLVK